MQSRRWLGLIGAVAMGLTGRGAEGGVYNAESFMLANGMQVIAVPQPRMPAVTHMVWYKVGAADDPVGLSGQAHFLEHLMFKGTESLAAGEFSRIVARHGGRENAFTSWDFTAYFQTVAADRLEMVMGMEADRMRGLKLSDEEVARERDVVREERRQRTGNDPDDRLGEAMQGLLFTHHPYGTPIIGWDHEIAGLNTRSALDFHQRWYAPNNAVLVVSGAVEVGRLRALADATYGALPARDVPERRRLTEPPANGERRVVVRDSQVRQPVLRRMYHAPTLRENGGEPGLALQIFDEIADGETGLLHRALVETRKVAVEVGLAYSGVNRDAGTLSVVASPAEGVSLAELEAALDAELARIRQEGVTAAAVDTARRRLQIAAAYARDSLSGPAYAFGMALTTGGSLDEVENWPERLQTVSVASVNRVMRQVLGGDGSVTGLLLPEAGDGAAGAGEAP